MDFLLNAFGQLSDDANTNFCSSVYGANNSGDNYFATDSASDATLEANDGLTGKSKCTW